MCVLGLSCVCVAAHMELAELKTTMNFVKNVVEYFMEDRGDIFNGRLHSQQFTHIHTHTLSLSVSLPLPLSCFHASNTQTHT